MSEKDQEAWNPFSYLIDSFWASLPEKTADELSTFKKDVLTTVRDSIDRLIDEEIRSTERHLDNARRMREQYRQKEAAAGEAGS